jgi:cytochrome c peroxidase
MKKVILIVISLLLFNSCSDEGNTPNTIPDVDFSIVPKHFPPIPFPADNPYSKAKFLLGRELFYDPMMSPDGSVKSCSHCMKQEYNFADNVAVNIGFKEQPQPRNTMTLTNVAYLKQIFWDGRTNRIESPAYRSFFLPTVFGSDTNIINTRLATSAHYREQFAEAFGDSIKPSVYYAAKAIATFVRCLFSGNSPYDRFINGDSSALSRTAVRGKDLFFSDKARCSVCHSGIFFTDEKYHNTGVVTHYFDWGRYYITGAYADRGKFITPSLRNCEISGPYMHDGELITLEQVIEHYNRGGRLFINKDTLIRPLNLSSQEKTDLIEFLKSLTDREYLQNKNFANPNQK